MAPKTYFTKEGTGPYEVADRTMADKGIVGIVEVGKGVRGIRYVFAAELIEVQEEA